MYLANRRRCLLLALGAGASAGIAGLSLFRRGAASDAADDSVRGSVLGNAIVRTSQALGTKVSITAFHQVPTVAAAAIDQAFAELDLVEDLMSIYRPHSQLSELNRAGSLTDPHPYLVSVLQHAYALSRKTAGAFDVTVQPLWQVFAQADRKGRLPQSADVRRVAALVNWRNLEISHGRIRLKTPGAAITLNGIAQGYAADRVAAVLRRRGIQHALIDTGEIGAVGGKRPDTPWTVGIQHPRRPDAYLSLTALQDRCLSTSGDYGTNFAGGHQYHHIFDPRTGISPTAVASVSVAARTGLQADALSTAAFVLGPENGLALIQATPGADGLIVLKNGRTLASRDFPIAKGVKQ